MGTTEGADAPETKTRALTRGMRWALIGIAVIVAAGLIGAGSLLVVRPGAGGSADTARSGSVQGPTQGTTESPGTPATPTTAPTPVDGSEVLPPETGQSDAARLPERTQASPLVAAPLPPDATAQGKLVDGFPTSVAAPVAGAEIIYSSIASEGTRMQAGLTARTEQSAAEIADHYRALWASLGLAPAGGDGSTVSYSGPFTSISLTTSETATGLVYKLFGTLRTE